MTILTCEHCGKKIERGDCLVLKKLNGYIFIHQKCEKEYMEGK